jgi:hypothetical protein
MDEVECEISARWDDTGAIITVAMYDPAGKTPVYHF